MGDPEQEPDASAAAERPIPDGGLARAMPDWLKAPPAWAKAPAPVERPLPPDISPIDPRTLVREEDVPGWLTAITRREHAAAAGAAAAGAAAAVHTGENVRAARDSAVNVARLAIERQQREATALAARSARLGWRRYARDPVLIGLIVLAIATIVAAVILTI